MTKLEFTLLENGLSYFFKAIDHLESTKEEDLKYVIRDLHTAVSLIFKERLRREHWSLLFDNVDSADLEALKKGHFQSVNLNESILRLNQIEDEELIPSDFQRDLYHLRDKRNQVEHYAISAKVNSIRSLVFRVLKHSLGFISNRFEIRNGEYDEEISLLRERIYSYESYRKKRLKEIQPDLDKFDVVFKCPVCLNQSFPLDEKDKSCLFCFHKEEDGEFLAADYRSNVLHICSYGIAKGRQDEALYTCTECGTESLILNFNDKGHICFECREVFPYNMFDWCDLCGQLISAKKETQICSSCWEYRWNKD